MNAYESLIKQEEAKLTLLRQKMRACEQRIAALKSLAESDDIDDAINNEVAKASSAAFKQASQATDSKAESGSRGQPTLLDTQSPRALRKDSVAPAVLAFLADGEKSLEEIVNELQRVGKPRNRDAMRTALMNWRKKQRWVTNPEPGRYGLSEAGRLAISSQMGEGPGV